MREELGIGLDNRDAKMRTPLWHTAADRPRCPASVATQRPDRTSQNLTVLSHDADAGWRPSGEKATDLTQPLGARTNLTEDRIFYWTLNCSG